ncbi:MAG TPA: DUF6159 family protein [Steroidobacteraceae bacterium]|nr:DUF6159 family protein [Steroidobacteraceae bacterium]
MSRISRSWRLIQASASVLRQDKELLLFPVLSTITTIIVIASLLIPAIATGYFDRAENERIQWLPVFLVYLVQYFIIFFFNTALVSAAMIRLEGGDPTVKDGLRIAWSKAGSILGYAGIAATVGLILRVIEERAGFVGRWIAALLGAGFTIATALTVPVLVSRDVGPVDAVKESAQLLRQTWGENIVGNGGMGFVFAFAYLGIVVLTVFTIVALSLPQSPMLLWIVIATGAIAILALALIHAALQGIYSAALYRYATGQSSGANFSDDTLNAAFRPKRG